MRALKPVAVGLVLAALVSVAWRILALTRTGDVVWFVRDRNTMVLVDGMVLNAWVHRSWRVTGYVLISLDHPHRVTYLVAEPPQTRGFDVEQCADWTAPRSPLILMPVVASEGLLCAGWLSDFEHLGERTRISSKVTLGPGVLEFAAVDGSRIRVKRR